MPDPTSTGYTKGPWRVEGPDPAANNPNMGLWSVEGVINIANHCTYADACLIESAPELYEALDELYDFARTHMNGLTWRFEDQPTAKRAKAVLDRLPRPIPADSEAEDSADVPFSIEWVREQARKSKAAEEAEAKPAPPRIVNQPSSEGGEKS